MRLIRYRVTNFRSVDDSGWIDVDQVTALIGVNESGKTNLLLPLWKLNPARDGQIRPNSDYPKAKFNEIRADPKAHIFIKAQFELDDLAEQIGRLANAAPENFNVVEFSRYYDGEYSFIFPLYKPQTSLEPSVLITDLRRAAEEIRATKPLQKEDGLNQLLADAVLKSVESISATTWMNAARIKALVSALSTSMPEAPAPTSSVIPVFRQLLEHLEEKAACISKVTAYDIEEIRKLVKDNLPRFVYYSNYGNLDSEIYLPHVVDNMSREQELGAREAAKVRTLRVLFKFVDLEPIEILKLGKDVSDGDKDNAALISSAAEGKRTRTIMLNSAGTKLTKEFRSWWKQGDYTFEFDADGNHFRIWVHDSIRPEKVELEDRSAGLQWFLSFYLVFLVESAEELANTILLLDEPGLSLHPLAQRDLSAFFDNLAETNQLIYTTHSPFLVDADMLDRARKVFVSDDGSTKASSDLRRGSDDPRKSGAIYAVHSALNMNVAESLLLGCHPVIVEGPSDQHYLATIKTLLIAAQKIAPKREIVFPPSHGAKNAKVVASILGGRDETLPVMLLDGDEAGQKAARDLQNGIYQPAKDRIMSTDTFTGIAGSEIEDLFPPEFLAEVVDRVYRHADSLFADDLQAGKPIVPQIKAWAEKQNVDLPEGWKVDVSRETKKRALQLGHQKFNGEIIERWKALFDTLETVS